MANYNDQHLTTEQLSAFIDKRLTAAELAGCNAHLQTCQHCQNTLAGLQQTVALLQALPQPALPRSFVLPSTVTYLQDRPEQQPTTRTRTRQRLWTDYAQHSLRAASAIAAVIGLVFLLSGLLPTLPRGGVSSSSGSTASAPQPAQHATTLSPKATIVGKPVTPPSLHDGTPVYKPGAIGTPVSAIRTPAAGNASQNHSPPIQSQPSIAALNLNTPLVRQILGFSLLVLGIVGFLLTRRKPRGPPVDVGGL